MKSLRGILIAISFLTLTASIASYVTYTIKADRERDAYYQQQDEALAKGEGLFSGPYCFPDRRPGFLFGIAALIAISLTLVLTTENASWSILPSTAALSVYAFLYWDTQRAISIAESSFLTGLDSYIYRATVFDVIVITLILAGHFVFIWSFCSRRSRLR